MSTAESGRPLSQLNHLLLPPQLIPRNGVAARAPTLSNCVRIKHSDALKTDKQQVRLERKHKRANMCAVLNGRENV